MAQERVNAARESSLQSSVERRIARWAGDKPLHAMLATLHVLLPKLVAADALAPVLHPYEHASRPSFMERHRAAPPRARVKKAYRRALRLIHPDKLTRAPMAQRVAGQCALAALAQQHAAEY